LIYRGYCIYFFYFTRSSLEYNRFGNNNTLLNAASSEFQTPTIALSDDDDSFSTTSWEEEEEELASDAEEEDTVESEEDEEFKAPVKYTPKKYKKSVNNNPIHPLSKKKSSNIQEQVQQQPINLGDLFVDNSSERLLPKASPRPTATPTIYQKLTKASVDWCRYCGTTEGVNWRPGPWGKRTLCK
jgi:hypothetical protein